MSAGIGADRGQGLSGGAEEQAVDESLGRRQWAPAAWRRLKVLRVGSSARRSSSYCPDQRLAAGAMPVSAAVEGNAPVTALITCFDVSAERGGPAQFNRSIAVMTRR